MRERKQRTLASLLKLVHANEERLAAGEIGDAPLLQARVEAQQFRAGVIAADGDIAAADLALVQSGTGARRSPARRLTCRATSTRGRSHARHERAHREGEELRPDLKAAERRVEVASRQVTLAHANRVVDSSFAVTWQHDFAVKNALLPAADLLGVTVSVPIPFSRVYHGELDAARATETQATLSAESVGLGVETQVRQAVAKYTAANAQVKLYTAGVLTDADKVLDKAVFHYQKGGTSLLEVLIAQRTVNDVYLAYDDALAAAAHALVAVQQATGTWDVSF